MDTTRAEEVLETLRRLQSKHELSIVRLSEPIASSAARDDGDSRQRGSDASSAPLDGPTPAGLEADLAHYTELFAKLRFSYVEQVTKEKFIRAIVGDPPLIVTMQENLDLERANGEAKAQLKSLKLEVADMVEELERRGRELSSRYERVRVETARLDELPDRIRELEAQVEELRAEHDVPGAAPGQNLPLAKTLGLVSKRKTEQQELVAQINRDVAKTMSEQPAAFAKALAAQAQQQEEREKRNERRTGRAGKAVAGAGGQAGR